MIPEQGRGSLWHACLAGPPSGDGILSHTLPTAPDGPRTQPSGGLCSFGKQRTERKEEPSAETLEPDQRVWVSPHDTCKVTSRVRMRI